MIGQSTWFDLPAANLSDCMAFYNGLLDWEYSQMENSVLSDYVMIQTNGKLIGGLRRVPAPIQPRTDFSVPLLYFTVDILEPKVQRAKELGAEIIGTMIDLGKDRGRYQWIRDREGNLVGLWAPQ